MTSCSLVRQCLAVSVAVIFLSPCVLLAQGCDRKAIMTSAADVYERPARYATGAGWQGVVTTLEALRSIVHALRGWPTPMGVAINSTQQDLGPGPGIADDKARMQLEAMAGEVMEFVKVRQAGFQPAG